MSDYNLFKFRKINKYLIQSLVNSELYFPRPSKLNDPFDCRVDIATSLRNAISRSRSSQRQGLEKLLSMDRFFTDVQRDLEGIGICCFSRELENSLLWSHYADCHRGICLVYSFPESFFFENRDFILGVDKVHYGADLLCDWFLNEAPSNSTYKEFGISLIQKILTIKSKPWQYEKESRILRRDVGTHAIDKSYLKQVCFGLATSEADFRLVKTLIEQGGYEVTFCRIERDNKSDFGIKTRKL